MTKQQYVAEQNRKEQERVAEQRRLEEIRLAEEKRQESERLAKEQKNKIDVDAALEFIKRKDKEYKNSGKIYKCRWCSNEYNSVEGWRLEGDCSGSPYGDYFNKGNGAQYCTTDCAKCGCLFEKGIRCSK